MISSATHSLLYRTFQETWHRGERYANDDTVNILFQSDKMATARVRGTQSYLVELEFKGSGLHRSCTCPVPDFCKHMVAVAIIWDEQRGMTRPSDHDIVTTAIPPPLVSTSDIRRAYDDPLHADLDVLRLASSGSGRWSRPHAHLPIKPTALRSTEDEPITLKEVTKCCSEIRWNSLMIPMADTFFLKNT